MHIIYQAKRRREAGMKDSLKHLIGLMAFFIAVGMLLMLFISSKVGAIVLIIFLLIVGYMCLMCDS